MDNKEFVELSKIMADALIAREFIHRANKKIKEMSELEIKSPSVHLCPYCGMKPNRCGC